MLIKRPINIINIHIFLDPKLRSKKAKTTVMSPGYSLTIAKTRTAQRIHLESLSFTSIQKWQRETQLLKEVQRRQHLPRLWSHVHTLFSLCAAPGVTFRRSCHLGQPSSTGLAWHSLDGSITASTFCHYGYTTMSGATSVSSSGL